MATLGKCVLLHSIYFQVLLKSHANSYYGTLVMNVMNIWPEAFLCGSPALANDESNICILTMTSTSSFLAFQSDIGSHLKLASNFLIYFHIPNQGSVMPVPFETLIPYGIIVAVSLSQ
jgi:hypothetical protein